MITGYGVCGVGEAGRYMRQTLDCFKQLCDEVVIVCNNAGQEEKNLIEEYGFKWIEDNREWGLNQHRIKESLMMELSKKERDIMVCLDMDEVLDITRKELESLKGNAFYFYIVNLWNDGWKKSRSFWNIRAWRWNGVIQFENRPLHCGLAPKWCYHSGAYVPYVMLHYGLKEKKDRLKKVERYNKYDPSAKYMDSSYYQSLLDDKSDPLDMQFIKKAVFNEASNYKPAQIIIPKTMKYFYVQRAVDGKVMDIPEKDLDETLKRGFTLIGEVVSQTAKEQPVVNVEAPVIDPPATEVGVVKTALDCDVCGFTAKTLTGLSVHRKKHRI